MSKPQNRYTLPAKLSTPASTRETSDSAARLAIGYRKLKQLPDEITKNELEGDKLEEYILGIGAFCSSNAIPHHFDQNLKSTREYDNHCCVTSTLLNYIGQHLNYLRKSIIPDHRDFINLRENEFPEWYTAFREDFRSACNRFQLLNTGDELFEGWDTMPLYRDLSNGRYGVNPYAQCDLKRIMLNIFKTAAKGNKKHEEGAWIITTWDAIGRPGEVKFIEFSDWSYDYLLKCVDTLWKESKTLTKYTMPRFTDEFFGFDWYCVLGGYFMCEQGLYRNEEQISAEKMNVLFPSLHQ